MRIRWKQTTKGTRTPLSHGGPRPPKQSEAPYTSWCLCWKRCSFSFFSLPADASREIKVGNPVPGTETVGTGAGAQALEGVSPKAAKVTCRGGKALPSGRENSWEKKGKIKEWGERANY